MRTYYAIYIYYGTYDITWYAFYAWIWTALEADLGVICASAPALKVFFRRYFNLSTNLNNESGPPRRNQPWIPTGESNKESRRCKTDLVPMNCIRISTRHHVTIENHDEMMSRSSDTSTRNLTALPSVPYIDNHSSLRYT